MAQANGRRHETLDRPVRDDTRSGSIPSPVVETPSGSVRGLDIRKSPPASERRGRVSSSANGTKAPSSGLVFSEGLPMAPRSAATLPPRPLSISVQPSQSFALPSSLPAKPGSTPSTTSTPTTGSFLVQDRDSPVKISFGGASRPKDRRDSGASRGRRESTSSGRPSDLLNGARASAAGPGREAPMVATNGVTTDDDLETAALKALLVESSQGQSKEQFMSGLKVTASQLKAPLVRPAGSAMISIPEPKKRAAIPLPSGAMSLPARPDASLALTRHAQRDDFPARPATMNRRPSSSDSSSSADMYPRRRASPARSRHQRDTYFGDASDDERYGSRSRGQRDTYPGDASDDERYRTRRDRPRSPRRRDDSHSRTREGSSPVYRGDRRGDSSRDWRDDDRRRSRRSPSRSDHGSDRDDRYYSSRRRDSPPPSSRRKGRSPSYGSPPRAEAPSSRHARETDRRRSVGRHDEDERSLRRQPAPAREDAAVSSAYASRRAAATSSTLPQRVDSPEIPKPLPPPVVNGTGIKIQLKTPATAAPADSASPAPVPSAPRPPQNATPPLPPAGRAPNGNSGHHDPVPAPPTLTLLKPQGFCHKPGRGNYRVTFDPDVDGAKADKGKSRVQRLDGIDKKGREVAVSDPRTLLSSGSKGLGSRTNRRELHAVPVYAWDEWSTGPKPAPPAGGITVTDLHPLTTNETIFKYMRRFGPIDEHELQINPRDGQSLGIFWVKFHDSPPPGKSAHQVAKEALAKTNGMRIGMGIQAQNERVKCVLDGSGSKATKEVDAELARRKAASSVRAPPRATPAQSKPVPAPQPPSEAASKPSDQTPAVAKPVAAAPPPHPSLVQGPRQPAWGQARTATPWTRAPAAPPTWQRLQQDRQQAAAARPLDLHTMPFHPLNPNLLENLARRNKGQPPLSATAVISPKAPAVATKISAASFAAAPDLTRGDADADSEEDEDEEGQDARAARLPAARARAHAVELDPQEAHRRAKEVTEALIKNGHPHLFIDKKIVALGADSAPKLQAAFGLVKCQAIIYDNHGWYVLFADGKAAKRVIKVVEGKRIDGRQILAEVREAAEPPARAPLSERRLSNTVRIVPPSPIKADELAASIGVKPTAKEQQSIEAVAQDDRGAPVQPNGHGPPPAPSSAPVPPKAAALEVKKETTPPLTSPLTLHGSVGEAAGDIPMKARDETVVNAAEEPPAPEETASVPSKRKPAAKDRKPKQPAKKKQKKRIESPAAEAVELKVDKPYSPAAVAAFLPAVTPTLALPPAPAIDDVIAAGIAEDDEDVYMLSQLIKRVADDKLPEAPTTQPHQIDQDAKNFTGCARTQGYYKVSELEKNAYLPSRNRAAVQDDPAPASTAAAASSAAATVTSRSNRVATRRLVQGLQQHQKATATDTDVFQFNQLRARKKHLKFSKSPIHDWGLYAMESIPAGEMVIEYVGEVIRAQVAELREKYYEKTGIGSSYLFRVDDDAVVDATKKGNLGRLINHCCAPNCTAKIITINGEKKIVIYAKTSIEPGEEITYDYHFPIENNKIPCLCGSPKCRGYLN